jgi:hypothetical protein
LTQVPSTPTGRQPLPLEEHLVCTVCDHRVAIRKMPSTCPICDGILDLVFEDKVRRAGRRLGAAAAAGLPDPASAAAPVGPGLSRFRPARLALVAAAGILEAGKPATLARTSWWS